MTHTVQTTVDTPVLIPAHTHNMQRHNAHTTEVCVRLHVGTLCKFYMRAKLMCGMSPCMVCVPEQGGCVNALNLK